MGKRSEFERNPMDYYPTPKEAVIPLLKHLPECVWFCEPCAGAGVLSAHLEAAGHLCVEAYDAEPQADWIGRKDASFLAEEDVQGCRYIITNPPWERVVLHQIIERCAALRPTWLLFDADWMHTRQSIPYMLMCEMIVSIGRVKWIADSEGAGKDNCCWYKFDRRNRLPTVFIGR